MSFIIIYVYIYILYNLYTTNYGSHGLQPTNCTNVQIIRVYRRGAIFIEPTKSTD